MLSLQTSPTATFLNAHCQRVENAGPKLSSKLTAASSARVVDSLSADKLGDPVTR